jgi:hypothetical protein
VSVFSVQLYCLGLLLLFKLSSKMLTKPKCFTDNQWQVYQTELRTVKGGKKLDICFDCTIAYQVQMRKQGSCDFPMKRLDKVTEFV